MQYLNKKYPKVSIITVCLNCEKYFEDAIKSAYEQTYQNIEYIIIDGGSTDGSIKIFNKYKNRIDKLIMEKDNGIFDAMNKGIKLATGEIIYFLNSDDKFYDNKVVEKVVTAFEDNKKADFIYGNLMVFDPVTSTSYIERYPEKISRSLFLKKTIGHPASFFRSDCFQKVGYFDESYKIASDYEWYLRAIFTKGLKGAHIENIVSIFRLGGNSSVERDMKAYFSERILIQKKYLNPLQILYTRFVFIMRILLRKEGVKFLHGIKTAYVEK